MDLVQLTGGPVISSKDLEQQLIKDPTAAARTVFAELERLYKENAALKRRCDPLLAENRGTADWLIVDRLRRRLTVVDLKYGKGVMVPGDSPQLKDYALMALVSVGVGGGWETVETVVVQPRAFAEAERVKSATFTPAGLMDAFLPALVGAMEESLDPKARLTPGKWCRWCPGAGPDERGQPVCPALADRAPDALCDELLVRLSAHPEDDICLLAVAVPDAR